MPTHDIIVIGASAGGVEAITKVVSDLPANLPAAVFVVLHVAPHSPSLLPAILNRVSPLSAMHPRDGEPIKNGNIYVAPPDYHLLLEAGHVRVIHGPKENRHRPAVDPMFRTAARIYGAQVVGVILTGALDDGTAGLLTVKQRGGVAIVQNPAEALYPSMPQSALNNVNVDYKLPIVEIAPRLVQLAHEEVGFDEGGSTVSEQNNAVREQINKEARIAALDADEIHGDSHPGTPSPYSCPECGGVLWELQDNELLRFRCRVGHAFSTETMLAEQTDAVEEALWIALKNLEETASFSRRLASQATDRGQAWLATRFQGRADEAQARAEVIRQVLIKQDGLSQVELNQPHYNFEGTDPTVNGTVASSEE